jgi:hypothetical protein
LSLAYLLNLLGNSTPRKYATQTAAAATALKRQYNTVLLYTCPPYPVQPGGKVVLGYHLTLNCSGNESPIVTLTLRECVLMLYAAAASTVPGATDFGAACTSRLRWFPTCRCESWRVPVRAMMRGV